MVWYTVNLFRDEGMWASQKLRICSHRLCTILLYSISFWNRCQMMDGLRPYNSLTSLCSVSCQYYSKKGQFCDISPKYARVTLPTSQWTYGFKLYNSVCIVVHKITFCYCIWVRSWRCGCPVTWFCYQLIAKPVKKTAAPSWPDPINHQISQQLPFICLEQVF